MAVFRKGPSCEGEGVGCSVWQGWVFDSFKFFVYEAKVKLCVVGENYPVFSQKIKELVGDFFEFFLAENHFVCYSCKFLTKRGNENPGIYQGGKIVDYPIAVELDGSDFNDMLFVRF